MNMDDFEEKFTLSGQQETQEESVTKIYNWRLDPTLNKELLGNLILDFNIRESETLRSDNPCNHYGRRTHIRGECSPNV